MTIDWLHLKYQTQIRVVFYGRVSSKHDSQLSAFENQSEWYYEQLKFHPNWILVDPVETYLDKGITGTQAKKRPGFLKMIKEAQTGKFDMIVTREVCRFARNTVDTLKYVRELKALGIQVYFVNDGIKTIEDNDGEQRLTLMAANAQEESRKISERSKSGQYISRKNGVLYGSGNILGYRRIRKRSDMDKRNAIGDKSLPTFAIVPDEAETVQMIYNLYKSGLGLRQVKNELIIAGRKNSQGKVNWFESTISRILSNPMYIGKQYQCKTVVTDYLEHTVKKNKKDDYVLIEGDFEPIISEELWYEVQRIKESKSIKSCFGDIEYGKRISEDKWLDKLECNCGSRFQRYKWRTNATTGEDIRGYTCKHRVKDGSTEFREKRGLHIDGACDIPTIPEWKIEFMGIRIFSEIWGDKKDFILEAYQYIIDSYKADDETEQQANEQLSIQKERYKQKIEKLTELYTEGDISKDEYRIKRQEYIKQIDLLDTKLEKSKDKKDVETMAQEKLQEIKDTLELIVDCSGEKIDNIVIKNYVDKMVMKSKTEFEWYINLHGDAPRFMQENDERRLNEPYEVKAAKTIEMRDRYYSPLFTIYVNFDEVRAFKKKFGKYIRSNQWEDIVIKVYMR